jgi:branched-chain amino acid transport system ATP-binding protein
LTSPLRPQPQASGGTAKETSHRGGKIVRLGLTMVPETKELFSDLSVNDNLALGGYVHRGGREATARHDETLAKVFELFPVLCERRASRAASLSGGSSRCLRSGAPS